jgi:hypothetical protein
MRRPRAHSRRGRRRRRAALDHKFSPLALGSSPSRRFPLPFEGRFSLPLRRELPIVSRPGPPGRGGDVSIAKVMTPPARRREIERAGKSLRSITAE